MNFSYGKVWTPVYEGEGDSGTPAADPDPQPTGKTDPQSNEDSANNSKVLTQEEVNRILANERRKAQQAIQRATEEAQAASKKASMTAQERQELEERLSQIKDELLTKEELSKKQQERLAKKHKEDVESLTSQRDSWQKRYTESTIKRALTDAAAASNAFSPRQIVAILGGDTRLVEVLDDDGRPTGEYEPKVRFADRDDKGKPVVLELSPSEAVGRMKETDEYLNLFRGEGSGGAGMRSQPGGRKPDVRNLARDPRAFREAKRKGLI